MKMLNKQFGKSLLFIIIILGICANTAFSKEDKMSILEDNMDKIRDNIQTYLKTVNFLELKG